MLQSGRRSYIHFEVIDRSVSCSLSYRSLSSPFVPRLSYTSESGPQGYWSMSSLQGDDLGSQPSPGRGAKSDAAPSLTMSTNDEEYYRSNRNDGEDPELNVAELSEQEPVDSTGGMYRARALDSENAAGEGYTAKDGNAESFALKLMSMIEGIIQQTQATMEGFLSNASEIDSSSVEVMEELQNAKDGGTDRKCKLEEDMDKVHQAVCRVLEVLNMTNEMTSTLIDDHAPPGFEVDPPGLLWPWLLVLHLLFLYAF